jgi:hypothetical protein
MFRLNPIRGASLAAANGELEYARASFTRGPYRETFGVAAALFRQQVISTTAHKMSAAHR